MKKSYYIYKYPNHACVYVANIAGVRKYLSDNNIVYKHYFKWKKWIHLNHYELVPTLQVELPLNLLVKFVEILKRKKFTEATYYRYLYDEKYNWAYKNHIRNLFVDSQWFCGVDLILEDFKNRENILNEMTNLDDIFSPLNKVSLNCIECIDIDFKVIISVYLLLQICVINYIFGVFK